MAFDAFIKIDTIPGECTDDKHKDWIEILSMNHFVSQPASSTASSAGGGTAERVEHSPITFTKLLDKASPKLHEACNTGQHLKEVTIEMCRAGGDKFKYLEIKLEAVVVSNVHTDAVMNSNAAGGPGFPTESVSLVYGSIEHTYFAQKRADGSGGGQVRAKWDLMKNAKG